MLMEKLFCWHSVDTVVVSPAGIRTMPPVFPKCGLLCCQFSKSPALRVSQSIATTAGLLLLTLKGFPKS